MGEVDFGEIPLNERGLNKLITRLKRFGFKEDDLEIKPDSYSPSLLVKGEEIKTLNDFRNLVKELNPEIDEFLIV